MEASQRLSTMAAMAFVLWIATTLLWHAVWPSFHPNEPVPGFKPNDLISVLGALSSLALWLFIRRSHRPPQFFLNLGLVYLVVTCLLIAVTMHFGLPKTERLEPIISWIGVVILMFAAVLPVDPKRMLIAGLIGAAMSPVSMAITRVHGLGVLESLKVGALMHYTDFMLAFIAYVISRIVTRLGRQVTKAREMGSYQLGELIKRGGMGEIYRATHRMLARPAAIKLIRTEMLAGEDSESIELAIKRFHREAEAAANLRCPHTVELFDFGITEDKTLYFVMELLEGLDLETLVREHGPLSPPRTIHILRQVCESLEEAHLKGLVHRDIKPANIHVGKVGVRQDFVKVLDFGLVKSVKKQDEGDSLATSVGRTPGTPAYMAPEMAVGENIDARADIYALGCVAYFLLTGKLVFEAETALQLIAKHLRNEPVPPSVRAGVDVPRQLEDLILACLATKPDDRPQSAAAVAATLASIRTSGWSDAQAESWWNGRVFAVPSLSSPFAQQAAHSPA